MIKLLALLLACLLLTSAIRNGKPVSADELKRLFSFVVSVKICGKECFVCAGSLVAPNTVLLAARCFCGLPESPKITVYFKSLNALRGRKVTGSLFKKKPIPCNNNRIYKADIDIAVIRLHQRVRDIYSVPLECGRVPTGQRVTMIGYGQTERHHAGTLRFGLTRTTKCPPMFTGVVCVDVTDRSLTSTGHQGDVGGPLLIHYRSSAGEVYTQVGITHSMITLMGFYRNESGGFTNRTRKIDTWTWVGAHCRWIRRAAKRTPPSYEY